MKLVTKRAFAGIAALLVAALPGIASADSVADFYKGRTITVYVGFGAGGGYDTNARIFAKHVVDHIPGHPSSVVKNMPGAGSKRVANYIYNVAPKDGTEFAIFASQLAFEPLLLGDKAQAKYDSLKFTWIGSLDQFIPIGIAWHTTGIKRLEDVEKKELKIGGTGGGFSGTTYAKLLNGMIGTKFNIIEGYRGSRDITHAMDQQEIPGFVGWYWAGLKRSRPNWLKEHKVNLFVYFAEGPNAEMNAIGGRSVYDSLTNPDDRKVMKLVLANLLLARPFAAPPGVPADRAKALQAAFEATVKDPAFLADMKKAKLNVNPVNAARIEAHLREIAETPDALKKRVEEAAFGK